MHDLHACAVLILILIVTDFWAIFWTLSYYLYSHSVGGFIADQINEQLKFIIIIIISILSLRPIIRKFEIMCVPIKNFVRVKFPWKPAVISSILIKY